MHDDKVTENRIRRELHERVAPAEISSRQPLEVTAAHLEAEPIPVAAVAELDLAAIAPGTPWGAPWGTTWFRATGEVPPRAPNGGEFEISVDIGFSGAMPGFQAEASIYRDGLIRCGVHPRRRGVALADVSGEGLIEFLVEASANPNFSESFRANPLGDRATAGGDPLYVYRGIDLVEFQPAVRRLRVELRTLDDLMRSLTFGSPRRRRLLRTISRALDALDLHDVVGSAEAAREVLAEGFDVPASADAHRLHAIGHAHIDTAWLWPMRETRRKCARTFSNQVRLMEEYPEHRFACSQAAQYEFVEQDHPELFEDITEMVAAGRWSPVGGMWVEADMNLPSGESLVRQLVYGQRYFEEHFGIRCREVWIPDVFGYPGTLPQIFRAAGCDRFLTQKLSWNRQNRFPHHSFTWEGTDGSTVAAHFPPVDTYNCDMSAREIIHAAANFSDSAWSDDSLVPFGYGDGGGGPSSEMLERARLLADTAGAPRIHMDAPEVFFDQLEADLSQPGTPHWRGELYFEMHRGTFTTQARTKVGNRRCEALLREVELWAATTGTEGLSGETEALWKRVLVQQFHDIIPGSSIAWVHDDAEAEHSAVQASAQRLIESMLADQPGPALMLANPATHPRTEVLTLPASFCGVVGEGGGEMWPEGSVQELSDGSVAAMVTTPGMAVGAPVPGDPGDAVVVEGGSISNSSIAVTLDPSGEITSIRDLRFSRELLPHGRCAATLLLAPDQPVEYDAWDLEEWTVPRSVVVPANGGVEVLERGPLLGRLRTRHTFGRSSVERTITLRAGSPRIDIGLQIEWHEDEKLLSVDFPLDVRTDAARCDAQFGFLERPTHRNTSWDAAKFEVCAHRWVDLSEPGFGVAVLNDGRYGHGVQDGGIRVSVLRAPRYPDPDADRGSHALTLALLPHGPQLADVVCEAEALNYPIRAVLRPQDVRATNVPQSPAILEVSDPRVSVSALKPADDGSGDLIVRMWESTGDRVALELRTDRALVAATRCDALEDPAASGDRQDSPLSVIDGVLALEMRPFELVTLRLQAG
ncbi:MAG: alpha-mannosidase [Microthrixaceae bacterium]